MVTTYGEGGVQYEGEASPEHGHDVPEPGTDTPSPAPPPPRKPRVVKSPAKPKKKLGKHKS